MPAITAFFVLIPDGVGNGQRTVRMFGERVRRRAYVLNPTSPGWRIYISGVRLQEEHRRNVTGESHHRPAIITRLFWERVLPWNDGQSATVHVG